MYFVMLKFSNNRDQMSTYLEGHKAWLQKGFDAKRFLLAGSLAPGTGGGILVSDTSREALDELLAEDPFVVEDVVTAEVIEFNPSRFDENLEFLSA